MSPFDMSCNIKLVCVSLMVNMRKCEIMAKVCYKVIKCWVIVSVYV